MIDEKRKQVEGLLVYYLKGLFIYYIIQFGGLGRPPPPPCNIVIHREDPIVMIIETILLLSLNNRLDLDNPGIEEVLLQLNEGFELPAIAHTTRSNLAAEQHSSSTSSLS